MACAEGLFPDDQRALEELFRLPILALRSIHVAQVVEGLAHVGVARAERLLPDDQRAPEERFRLDVLSLVSIHER